ncbi:hypothetical protein [Luteimonas terricola]|uniref:Uncharacterized protein n=1 Tax=Luteimonas terricola TaxID=645597 RepID=A0ABQ2E907_9GAMM|nr:hypothetical protein [Luteimonas terricola]GGK01539.1 hypothetical protein GCM10011394_08440 [Luteimonas terricola]
MSLTLGLTGMDPATETALKAAFGAANARLGTRWSLVPDAEAGHVIVDMDSMYGPMSWLRLHASGRRVIGLTSAPRTQTDYRLGRPFDTEQLMALLTEVARAEGVELQADATDTAIPAPVTAPAPVPATPAVPPAPAPPPAAPAHVTEAAAEPTGEAPAAVEAPPQPTGPVAYLSGDTMAAWLQPGALAGRVRYGRGSGPSLLIDASTDTWFGPTPLKAIAAYFEGAVTRSDFEPVEAEAWTRETASAGAAQPLVRLRWLGGLLAGGGTLLPGLDPQDRFQLHKWPQTEREYPRHFRIATQMMKGPATVAEIAQASGVPEADVTDFVNANLATGFATPVVDTPPPAEEAAKSRGGLLGRLRNR